jgi:TRAP-type mannitol/chloroaromatic compound transport system permease large subunit
MTGTTVGLLMFGLMLVMMAVRIPIAASMFIPGAIGYWVMTSNTTLLNMLKGSAVARLTVYDLSVIPLFLLMGQFATQGGLSRALFWRRRPSGAYPIRGGLAMSAIIAAAAFARCTALGGQWPPRAGGYPRDEVPFPLHGRLSTGVLATGGTLGIPIPPRCRWCMPSSPSRTSREVVRRAFVRAHRAAGYIIVYRIRRVRLDLAALPRAPASTLEGAARRGPS